MARRLLSISALEWLINKRADPRLPKVTASVAPVAPVSARPSRYLTALAMRHVLHRPGRQCVVSGSLIVDAAVRSNLDLGPGA